MRALTAIALMALGTQPVSAHCYRVWHFSQPQRCGFIAAHAPLPRPHWPAPPVPAAKLEEPPPDIPLPLLEPFAPAPEGPERLKAIGLLTQIVRID